MGNSFGRLFQISTFGESHGPAVGVVIDGCPSQIPIDVATIQSELDRRKPGQSKIVSQRREPDLVEVLSGVHESGLSLGTPIALLIRNQDARAQDYEEMRLKFRPSHADFTYDEKYGIRAWQGGGRASARETIGRVAAGSIARTLLQLRWGVTITAWVECVQDLRASVDANTVTREAVEANPIRCPDPEAAKKMMERIEAIRKDGNSVGGIIACAATGVPSGWGEPVFDKLDAEIAKAIMSLPACKGVEIGSGFAGTLLTGAEHNDPYYADDERHVSSPTNNSGGIQGGISNGMPIFFRAAFKPTATIMREQHTVTEARENTTLQGRGRHDPCVLPRAVPIVEAMVALVLADFAMQQQSRVRS